VIFIIRLFFLQVVDTELKLSAENNTLRQITQYPSRGVIFDRNGKILVSNKAYYDLKVVPRSLNAFDTLHFAELIGIAPDVLKEKLNSSKRSYQPITVKKQISSEEYAYIQEQLFKYPDFYVEKRTLREYSEKSAAHVLGYIGEVDVNNLQNDSYYASGDFIGKSGIEKMYEKYLRGRKGVDIYVVDVHGKIQGNYKEERYDKTAEAGKYVVSSIDSDLQAYGEYLMQNKIGGIVAIEPATGEILALVTSPAYEPELFVGKKLSENYSEIEARKGKPLFNRALRSMQPPGSTFKPVNALIGLQKGVITKRTVFVTQGYDAGTHMVRDHIFGQVTFEKSLQFSGNAYYCNVYKRIITNDEFSSFEEAYEDWKSYVESFGLGVKLGTDLDFEKKGVLYPASYYNSYYGKGRWNYNTIISLAIGQGELGFSPLQTANMTAAIANRGYYITPHIVKEVEGESLNPIYKIKHYTKIDSIHYIPVINGMEKVVSAGSGLTAFSPGLDICGKTGTAQNPHGDNHSLFIAFAPKDNPKIAISVLVENAGYGSTWAAPIAGLMIEKYLTDTISKTWMENRIVNANFMKD
jgi:penicillin-binding protein 2